MGYYYWATGNNFGTKRPPFLSIGASGINKFWISFGQATAGHYSSKEAAFLNWAIISVKKMGHYYRATGQRQRNGGHLF